MASAAIVARGRAPGVANDPGRPRTHVTRERVRPTWVATRRSIRLLEAQKARR